MTIGKWTTCLKNGPMAWTDALPKKIHRWQISTWKDTTYIITEMQVKTTMGYHCTPFSMAKIWNTGNTKCWQECGITKSYRWWECKMVVTLEDSLPVAYKTKHTLPIKSRNCTPYYLSKWLENSCPYKAWTQILIAALVIIAQTLKQPICSSLGELITKLWYIQTMKYSVLKYKIYQGMKRHRRTLNSY